jgi:hypothetical protein
VLHKDAQAEDVHLDVIEGGEILDPHGLVQDHLPVGGVEIGTTGLALEELLEPQEVFLSPQSLNVLEYDSVELGAGSIDRLRLADNRTHWLADAGFGGGFVRRLAGGDQRFETRELAGIGHVTVEALDDVIDVDSGYLLDVGEVGEVQELKSLGG